MISHNANFNAYKEHCGWDNKLTQNDMNVSPQSFIIFTDCTYRSRLSSRCYALHNMPPLYQTQFMSPNIVPRQLRCNDKPLLQVPLTSLKYAGDRSFQKAAPMLYNGLRVTIKQSLLYQSLTTR